MSGEIEIIDDFLPEEDFLRIKSILMAEDFPWFTSTVVDLSLIHI